MRQFVIDVILLAPLLAGAGAVWAQSPPQQFTANFTNGSQVVTVNFERYSIRSTNFSVVVQDSAGALIPHAAAESANLGTPAAYSGAIACAIRKAPSLPRSGGECRGEEGFMSELARQCRIAG